MKTKIVDKIFIIIGILGILDTVLTMAANAGPNVGTVFPGFLGMILVAWVKYKWFIIQKVPDRSYFILQRIFLVLTGLWLISFVIIEGFIFSAAFSKQTAEVDYLVVLGTGLNGKQISLALKERLDTAVDFLKKNPNVRVVVSGGQGYGEAITEAEAMKEYLIQKNIDESRIIKEDKSSSTMENFKFTKKILNEIDKKPTYKVEIVTNDFHMFRSKLLANRNGFIAYGISAKTPFYILPNCLIREYFAVIKSWMVDR